jgi:hypothetical protein
MTGGHASGGEGARERQAERQAAEPDGEHVMGGRASELKSEHAGAAHACRPTTKVVELRHRFEEEEVLNESCH